MFNCDKCGECCRNLDKSPMYNDLHNGDGICKHLIGNECSIYHERPLICRVDEGYEAFFQNEMGYEEYLHLTYECCKILKQKKEE